MKSITYYLTLLVIKLKGVKTEFKKDPIDYIKLRRQDVHKPKAGHFSPRSINQFGVRESIITEVLPEKPNEHLIIFCPGGAFVYGPVQHHWDAAKKITSETGCKSWMIDYPKAPEHTIDLISNNVDSVYEKAILKYPGKKIILIGDSVGATLILALVQRLIHKKKELPSLLVLISPVMDATFSNLAIGEIDKTDPILSKAGVLSAKRMCAINGDLEDVRLSPLNGSFEDLPPTVLFLAENDITYSDQKIALQKIRDAGVQVKTYLGKGMPHIWPLLPVIHEGKMALEKVIGEIKMISR